MNMMIIKKMLDILEKMTSYIEIIPENKIIKKFVKDIISVKKTSSWWSEETSLVMNLYRIKASKKLFDFLKKYETFCKYIPYGKKSIFGYSSDLVVKTDFGVSDIAFFDEEGHIILKTVTHEGYIFIIKNIKVLQTQDN